MSSPAPRVLKSEGKRELPDAGGKEDASAGAARGSCQDLPLSFLLQFLDFLSYVFWDLLWRTQCVWSLCPIQVIKTMRFCRLHPCMVSWEQLVFSCLIGAWARWSLHLLSGPQVFLPHWQRNSLNHAKLVIARWFEQALPSFFWGCKHVKVLTALLNIALPFL